MTAESTRQRIQRARQTHRLARWEHTILDCAGEPEQVHCPLCGDLIYARRLLEEPGRVEVGSLPNYQLVVFDFDDRMPHFGALCVRCASRSDLADFREEMYLADLEQMYRRNLAALGPVRADEWLAMMGDRQPTRCYVPKWSVERR